MSDSASILPLVTGTSQAAGGYANYNAQLAQGQYNRSGANMNAQIAQQQAGEATAAGEVAAQRRYKQGALDAGRRRVGRRR